MAEWVDVTGPEYFSIDYGDWDEGALPWEPWWMSRGFIWIYGDDGEGNYYPNFVYKVRVTVNITSADQGMAFELEIPDGERVYEVDYWSTPGVGEHTITYDLNTPGHIPYVIVVLFYYTASVTKIEFFMDPLVPPEKRFWTNFIGSYETGTTC
jgi:hypothetical protein